MFQEYVPLETKFGTGMILIDKENNYAVMTFDISFGLSRQSYTLLAPSYSPNAIKYLSKNAIHFTMVRIMLDVKAVLRSDCE